MQTSVSLLERLQGPRDALAWARFVDIYTPVLMTWGRRLGLDEASTADLVQEVFLLLVKKLAEFRYRPEQSFRAWLKTVTRNKHREMTRRRALPLAGEVDLGELPDPLEEFWEVDYRHHLMGQVMRVAQRDFQPTTWQAFHEVVIAGRQPDVVAAQLGISVNAVYVARSRVTRRLRQELAGLFD